MKKYIVLSIPLIAVAVISLLFMNFINKKTVTTDIKNGNHSCCSEEFEGTVSDNSIYQLISIWKNQEGHNLILKSFQGKPVVLTMFYSSCTYACPLLVNDMQRIENSLPADKKNNYQFVLVSIDPERDTPAKLKTYAKEHGLDLSRWTLLTGKSDDIMELAALTGFKYKKDDNGNYSHSNVITLLNEKGEILHQQAGLNQDIAESVNQLKNL